MILGQDAAVAALEAAWTSRSMHHAWLLAGPQGVGKARLAWHAATRVLAEAAGPAIEAPWPDTPDEHPIARLVAAGSHPDLRALERLENAKTGNLARNITVDQVRTLSELFAATPFLSPWRVVVIDSVDDMERGAANALLKMLEEPPANSLFLLVSHAPGRLLPTIRSRCRRLDLQPLNDDAMASVVRAAVPEMEGEALAKLVSAAGGSAGRAIAFARLDLAPLHEKSLHILRRGDPTNADRSALAAAFARKGSGDRYLAFLQMVPPLLAREARIREGEGRARVLAAYGKARQLAATAPRLSLDPQTTAFLMGSILAGAAPSALA